MYAFWYAVDLDDVVLGLTRSFLVLFGFISLLIVSLFLRKQMKWSMIPLAVRVYYLGWLSVWTVFASYIFLTNTTPFGEWFRSLYGSAYLGVLSGTFWCLYYAARNETVVRAAQALESEVQQALKQFNDKEDVNTTSSVERGSGGEHK